MLDTGAMTSTRLLLLAILSILAFQAGCIGRQPPQQGTWSKQDGFKTKVSDERKHSPANPE
jgi:hypothetical protein